MFENIKYDSYPRNADMNESPIEYEQQLFTKQLIYHLKYNILERLKVSSIKRSFDNIMYKSNSWNADLVDLPFDNDKKLISEYQIYNVNDDIIFRLNNGSIIGTYMNRIKEE